MVILLLTESILCVGIWPPCSLVIWLKDTVVPDNTIVTENAGKACILMEYHGAELKALVDHFHLKKSITGEGAKKVQL